MSGPKVSSDLISCVKTATKGCHICLWYPTEEAPSVGGDWIVDYDEIEEGEGGPDFAIDPEDNLLTVRNVTSEPRTYYLSLQKGRLLTEDGDALETDAAAELKTFPLVGKGPFLCTQAAGGSLTHFAHAGTNYALDFRCEAGTPVRSVCDGRVIDVRAANTCGGIDVDNLYKWNSITIQSLKDSICFDYVHLSADGMTVQSQ
ncbi:hypothetical protein FOZ60_016139 [Perkinsus olseni]|uniref:Uncharacterized protein n=1 Tax=Perkinsus olseni TaxID=32597 RepID=A0A7J6P720_PEROL|nr:hypothetical protein FOZ60_016139 [Perkinsus olseni]